VITPQGLRIGRDPANEVHLEDTDVSRAHARVLLHNGAVWVQDAGSRNGVFVNEGRVTEHKQLSPGDALVIGPHRFSVGLQELLDEHSVSVSLDSVKEPAPRNKGWRIWPFALTFLLVAGCIGVIGLRAGASGDAETTPKAYSLEQLMGQETTPTDPATDGDLSLKEGLAINAATEAGCDPPAEGLGAQALVEEGHSHYSSGRLSEAICSYRAALVLDPDCEICLVRIDRLEDELTEEIDRQFQMGLRYYDSLRFQQAIAAWEMVLILEPDEDSAMHQRTQEYVEQAKEKLEAQGRY